MCIPNWEGHVSCLFLDAGWTTVGSCPEWFSSFVLSVSSSKLNPGLRTACSKLPELCSSCGKALCDAYFYRIHAALSREPRVSYRSPETAHLGWADRFCIANGIWTQTLSLIKVKDCMKRVAIFFILACPQYCSLISEKRMQYRHCSADVYITHTY